MKLRCPAKKTIKNICSVLRSERGETLMEGVASSLVLAVLLAAVTMMIMVALRITSVSTREATASRDAANEVMKGDVPLNPETVKLVFTNDDEITVPVIIYEKDGFTAFAP